MSLVVKCYSQPNNKNRKCCKICIKAWIFGSLYLINPKGLPFSSVSFSVAAWKVGRGHCQRLLMWMGYCCGTSGSILPSGRWHYLCEWHIYVLLISLANVFLLSQWKKQTGFYSKMSSENKNPEGLLSVRIIRLSEF